MVKAIIAAAGMGTRLIPITLEKPKCLLKINGKEIIHHQIEILNKLGIKDIIVVTGYLEDMIKNLLGSKVSYVSNKRYSETNSSYSFRLAIEETDESFIYINSDLLFTETMLNSLLVSNAQNCMLIDTSEFNREDMFKIQLVNGQIKRLSKDIDISLSDGAAVGPVKFSGSSVKSIISLIDHYIRMGDEQKWFYTIVDEMADMFNIVSVDIKGEKWFEIDDIDDLDECRSFYS